MTLAQGGIESFELRHNPAENRFGWIPARWIRRSRGARHHTIHGVFDRIDGHDSEFPCRNSFDHRVAEYDVVGIDPRDDNALLTRETAGFDTGPEKALNLVMDTADRLRAAVLIERTGDRHALVDRHAGQLREDRNQLRNRSAVAFNIAIALLEGDGAIG